MIDVKTLQEWLKARYGFTGHLDGRYGPQTQAAVSQALGQSNWSPARQRVAAEQLVFQASGLYNDVIDGIAGPNTLSARARWIEMSRDYPDQFPPSVQPIETWPRQRDVPTFFGTMGENLHPVVVPWPIFYSGKSIKRNEIAMHKRVVKSALRVFEKVHKAYGDKEIKRLGLDQYSGCFNIRKMRGGSSWSMHSWAIAVDWDSQNNQFTWDHTRASFARAEYETWWQAWEAEGWLSLGRARDFDWMHVQAARL